MKLQKLIFVLSLLGIILLLLFSNSKAAKPGKITSIAYSENKITIGLENQTEKLIIFDDKILNLKIGDEIFYTGKEDTYKNQKQIIVNKIEK